jgi:hypothetical protein
VLGWTRCELGFRVRQFSLYLGFGYLDYEAERRRDVPGCRHDTGRAGNGGHGDQHSPHVFQGHPRVNGREVQQVRRRRRINSNERGSRMP